MLRQNWGVKGLVYSFSQFGWRLDIYIAQQPNILRALSPITSTTTKGRKLAGVSSSSQFTGWCYRQGKSGASQRSAVCFWAACTLVCSCCGGALQPVFLPICSTGPSVCFTRGNNQSNLRVSTKCIRMWMQANRTLSSGLEGRTEGLRYSSYGSQHFQTPPPQLLTTL